MNKPVPVLMYHNISDDKDDKSSVYYKDFHNQIKYLTKLGYTCCTLNNINNESINKKIVITFDDGYESVFKIALPILLKFNQKATCFIVHDYIGKSNLWDFNNKNIKLRRNI